MYNHNHKKPSQVYKRIRLQQKRRKRRERIVKCCLAGILVGAILITAAVKSSHNSKTQAQDSNQVMVDETASNEETQQQTVPAKPPYPKMSASYMELTSDALKSPYIALVDLDNNQVIAGRESNQRIYPASMTKVMTLIVAVENIKDLNQKFAITADMLTPLIQDDASRAGFDPGEEVSAEDLLYGLILPSGADAAVALADMVAGSEEKFVELMNQKVRELGLQNTHFMNTSGLHDENHYTTPVEMAMIIQYAMKNEICAKILSTYQHTTAVTPQHPSGILLTSTTFGRMYGNEVEGVSIVAGKTGYTDESRQCLVTYAVKGNRHFAAVTAGASSKWHPIFDDFELYKNYTGE